MKINEISYSLIDDYPDQLFSIVVHDWQNTRLKKIENLVSKSHQMK